MSLERVLRSGVLLCYPDDHQFINDGDGRMAPGGSLAVLLANNWTGSQAEGQYGATTTCSQLCVAGLTLFNRWFTNHWIGKPTPDSRYVAKGFGSVRMIMVDTRTARIPGSSMLGAAQKAWLRDQITSLGQSNLTTLLIIAQGGWSAAIFKAAEGFDRHAESEYREIIDHLYDSIPPSKNVLLMSSDDHLNYAYHHATETPNNPLMRLPLRDELKSSGLNATLFKAGYSVLGDKLRWFFDTTAANSTGILSNGVHCTIAPDGSAMRARKWSVRGGSNVLSEYTLFGSMNGPRGVTIPGLLPETQCFVQTQAVDDRGERGRWSASTLVSTTGD